MYLCVIYLTIAVDFGNILQQSVLVGKGEPNLTLGVENSVHYVVCHQFFQEFLLLVSMDASKLRLQEIACLEVPLHKGKGTYYSLMKLELPKF